ncbi:HAD family hydrolase [Aeromonas media]|uniref:HAD family hydrolase n=1 Tax=Aeromonas media TaxID=651 RepID=UPI0029DA6F13|nr:HAD hydrolase-like protein [Aeromonas media]MDX7899827.1 HAD hydrolase-like protein [Aeromonas media]
MRLLNDYEVYIFDCDGVILNSNKLKIDAMKNVLLAHSFSSQQVEKCLDYFRNNFGKSRFHHVDFFLKNILNVSPSRKNELEKDILQDFSMQCRELYLSAELTDGFISFITACNGKRYVASGSEQGELRDVFSQRGLSKYFSEIFGSPRPKIEIVRHILELEKTTNAVMFGDAESDMFSARENNIDFIFYSPLSNVREAMVEKCTAYGYQIIDDFSKVRI